ncbi:MAG: hypothetical protein Q9191_000145 [Dirinaria sp. TL-2023a]
MPVPCVCDPYSIDDDLFDTFPERRGYRLVSQDGFPKFILNADGSRLTSEQLANIAQAWLFFDFLAAFFRASGISIDPNDFVQREGAYKFITMRSLSSYLDRWSRANAQRSKQIIKEHYREQQRIITLSTVFRYHQISDNWFHDSDSWSTVVEPLEERYKMTIPLSIELSIAILQETLDRASRQFRGIRHDLGDGEFLCKGLMESLREDGWCPSERSLILQMFADTSAFFASRLERLRTRANHTDCTTNKCFAFNINVDEYKTQHTKECKGCTDVGISHDALAEMLRLGKTPRVRVDMKGGDAGIELMLADSGPYVAISHVWSDGLGNATANALPSCQLLRLGKMVMDLGIEFDQGLPQLWIDSLLVPAKKGVEKRWALNRLSQYYTEATKVLVLDADLLQASKYSSQEEQMTRLFFCTWMRRLWTLEEGILSRDRLAFQFRDGAINMDQLSFKSTVSDRLDNIGNNLYSALGIFLPDLASQHQQGPKETQKESNTLIDLLPVLQYRSTTKAADETICISHILRLDVSTLTCIEEADLRMKELFRLLGEQKTLFPRRLLFTNEPKLQFDGTQWAPASFMSFDREDVRYLVQSSSEDRSFYCIDKGLLVDALDGVMLDFGQEVFKKITFVEIGKIIYALTPTPIGENCRERKRWWSMEQQERTLSPDSARNWSLGCQELLGQSPRRTALVYESTESALLVYIHSTERLSDEINDVLLYARPISRFYMQELKVRGQNYPIAGADADIINFITPNWDFERIEVQMQEELRNFHDPATSTFLHGKSVDRSQRWCIG